MKNQHSKKGLSDCVAPHTLLRACYAWIYALGERRTAGIINALHLDGAT